MKTKHADWRNTVPVVDAHAHFSAGTVGDCLGFMDQNGVATMVDMDTQYHSTAPRREAFRGRLAATRRHPGRFGVFVGVDFEGFGTDGWIDRECERVREAIEAGAIGVKFWKDLGLNHTDQGGNVIPVDDRRLAPLLGTVGDLDGIAAFHTADPQPFFDPLTPENPRYETLREKPEWWFGDRSEHPFGWWELLHQLETVIERHPETTILGVHFGCAPEEPDYVAEVMRANPNYIIDTAGRVRHLGQHDRETIRAVFEEFPDRILFGTDLVLRDGSNFSPETVEATYATHWEFFETDRSNVLDHSLGDWTVDGLDLGRELLKKFYVENARQHFGLETQQVK